MKGNSRKFVDLSGLCSENNYDAVLVGGGIMSATLAVLLHELDPDLRVLIVERLRAPGLESSASVNNAGTGHAANCELNYTPQMANGTLSIEKALKINSSFEQSLEFWSFLTSIGKLNPKDFLNWLPHISFVSGDSNAAFLKKRFNKMSAYEAFSSMEWSMDPGELKEWMPIIMDGRTKFKKVAATRVRRGMDVDFGILTSSYLETLKSNSSFELKLNAEVLDLKRSEKNKWELEVQDESGIHSVHCKFVFLGAGGGTLSLLQKSSIPEAVGYGGFPVSGQWLVCSNENLAEYHQAKVYGKAKVGAPPMSVPHLDTRWINGKKSLLFGPYAGFSGKFMKYGSNFDLIRSIRFGNLSPMLQVGFKNIDLINYLIKQVSQSSKDRFTALQEFLPKAKQQDWDLSIAGQRVQIIKQTASGGILQMGTEVVTSKDGSLAALLGASPGASTAVTIMLDVLKRCWREQMASDSWKVRLHKILPSFGNDLIQDEKLFASIRHRNNSILQFS